MNRSTAATGEPVDYTAGVTMGSVEQDIRLTYNTFCTLLATLANLSVISLMIYGKRVGATTSQL